MIEICPYIKYDSPRPHGYIEISQNCDARLIEECAFKHSNYTITSS